MYDSLRRHPAMALKERRDKDDQDCANCDEFRDPSRQHRRSTHNRGKCRDSSFAIFLLAPRKRSSRLQGLQIEIGNDFGNNLAVNYSPV